MQKKIIAFFIFFIVSQAFASPVHIEVYHKNKLYIIPAIKINFGNDPVYIQIEETQEAKSYNVKLKEEIWCELYGVKGVDVYNKVNFQRETHDAWLEFDLQKDEKPRLRHKIQYSAIEGNESLFKSGDYYYLSSTNTKEIYGSTDPVVLQEVFGLKNKVIMMADEPQQKKYYDLSVAKSVFDEKAGNKVYYYPQSSKMVVIDTINSQNGFEDTKRVSHRIKMPFSLYSTHNYSSRYDDIIRELFSLSSKNVLSKRSNEYDWVKSNIISRIYSKYDEAKNENIVDTSILERQQHFDTSSPIRFFWQQKKTIDDYLKKHSIQTSPPTKLMQRIHLLKEFYSFDKDSVYSTLKAYDLASLEDHREKMFIFLLQNDLEATEKLLDYIQDCIDRSLKDKSKIISARVRETLQIMGEGEDISIWEIFNEAVISKEYITELPGILPDYFQSNYPLLLPKLRVEMLEKSKNLQYRILQHIATETLGVCLENRSVAESMIYLSNEIGITVNSAWELLSEGVPDSQQSSQQILTELLQQEDYDHFFKEEENQKKYLEEIYQNIFSDHWQKYWKYAYPQPGKVLQNAQQIARDLKLSEEPEKVSLTFLASKIASSSEEANVTKPQIWQLKIIDSDTNTSYIIPVVAVGKENILLQIANTRAIYDLPSDKEKQWYNLYDYENVEIIDTTQFKEKLGIHFFHFKRNYLQKKSDDKNKPRLKDEYRIDYDNSAYRIYKISENYVFIPQPKSDEEKRIGYQFSDYHCAKQIFLEEYQKKLVQFFENTNPPKDIAIYNIDGNLQKDEFLGTETIIYYPQIPVFSEIIVSVVDNQNIRNRYCVDITSTKGKPEVFSYFTKGFCPETHDLVLQPLFYSEYLRLRSISDEIIERDKVFYLQNNFEKDKFAFSQEKQKQRDFYPSDMRKKYLLEIEK